MGIRFLAGGHGFAVFEELGIAVRQQFYLAD